jgi:hypothetical protein
VEANYRGRGKYYPGKIKYDNRDGTYDIDYDDGEKERSVKEIDINRSEGDDRFSHSSPRDRHSKSLHVGDKVDANYRGRGKFYPGIVSRDRGDDTYDIDYDDGEKESRVGKDNIMAVKAVSRSPRHDRYISVNFCEGDRIEANYQGRGKYHSGKIKYDNRDGTFDIEYDDGDKERGVTLDMIRSLSSASPRHDSVSSAFREGERVEANFRGKGKFHPAKISIDRGDGTYDLDYEDGDKEKRVRKDLIRPLSRSSSSRSPRGVQAPALKVGDRIEARDGHFEEKGIVHRDNYDGTFDVEFDSGKKGRNLRVSDIRLIDRPGSPSNLRHTRFRDID